MEDDVSAAPLKWSAEPSKIASSGRRSLQAAMLQWATLRTQWEGVDYMWCPQILCSLTRRLPGFQALSSSNPVTSVSKFSKMIDGLVSVECRPASLLGSCKDSDRYLKEWSNPVYDMIKGARHLPILRSLLSSRRSVGKLSYSGQYCLQDTNQDLTRSRYGKHLIVSCELGQQPQQ